MCAALALMIDEPTALRGDRADGPAAEPASADLALVARAQAGDEQAFADLMTRHRRAVYRAAYAALGSAHDAEDVAQDTFVTVYQKLHGFRGEASFRTWLLSIAWRKALDRRRSVGRWLRMTVTGTQTDEDRQDPLDRVASGARTQEEDLAGSEMQAAVKRLIATLPRKVRDPLLLAGSGEYAYEQIAQMLQIPVGTVKWRVSEARRILKKKLAATGYAYD